MVSADNQSCLHPLPELPSPFPSWVRQVGLCFPAGLPDERLVDLGCQQLRAWNLQPVLAAARAAGSIPARRYLAGTDADRAVELLQLIQNPAVDVILAVRGGFGCARLSPPLSAALLAANPKPIIGYSDLTALHALSFSAGLTVNLSGPMLAVEFARLRTTVSGDRGADQQFTFRSLREAWIPRPEVSLPSPTVLRVWRTGTARGRLFPATLTVLTSLLGTPYFPDLSGAVLVLEDVNEPCYRLDRCLNQLRQAGVFAQLAGLLWGSFNGVEDNPEWLIQLFREYSELVPGPVASGLPYGHVTPSLTLPVGRIARLRTDQQDVAELAW